MSSSVRLHFVPSHMLFEIITPDIPNRKNSSRKQISPLYKELET